jgi:Predicted dehydrogenases and related proteins
MDAANKELRVGIIGLGRPRNTEGWTGWGMSHPHAKGYNAIGKCRIVALCDIVEEKARLFNDEHAEGKAHLYTDYQKMLAEAELDIVSVCTWPALHASMVEAAAQAGVKAIHCEKPMAPTWGEAKRMAAVCAERGVQLTFDHQRRFLESFHTARQLVKDGVIGELKRVEGACPNLLDWGTHWINMFLFYNDEEPATWVLGQVDARRPMHVYGVPHDTQGMSVMRFANGVTGTLYTGHEASDIVGCANRLIGTEGTIEVHGESPSVRVRGKGDTELRAADLLTMEGGIHGDKAITRGIADLIDALETGRKPLLDVDNALKTTEIIYATYLSAKQRGRVDLPLDYEGNAFSDLIGEGAYPGFPAEQRDAEQGAPSAHLRGA